MGKSLWAMSVEVVPAAIWPWDIPEFGVKSMKWQI
jgi:hypothetical protein